MQFIEGVDGKLRIFLVKIFSTVTKIIYMENILNKIIEIIEKYYNYFVT